MHSTPLLAMLGALFGIGNTSSRTLRIGGAGGFSVWATAEHDNPKPTGPWVVVELRYGEDLKSSFATAPLSEPLWQVEEVVRSFINHYSQGLEVVGDLNHLLGLVREVYGRRAIGTVRP